MQPHNVCRDLAFTTRMLLPAASAALHRSWGMQQSARRCSSAVQVSADVLICFRNQAICTNRLDLVLPPALPGQMSVTEAAPPKTVYDVKQAVRGGAAIDEEEGMVVSPIPAKWAEWTS